MHLESGTPFVPKKFRHNCRVVPCCLVAERGRDKRASDEMWAAGGNSGIGDLPGCLAMGLGSPAGQLGGSVTHLVTDPPGPATQEGAHRETSVSHCAPGSQEMVPPYLDTGSEAR